MATLTVERLLAAGAEADQEDDYGTIGHGRQRHFPSPVPLYISFVVLHASQTVGA